MDLTALPYKKGTSSLANVYDASSLLTYDKMLAWASAANPDEPLTGSSMDGICLIEKYLTDTLGEVVTWGYVSGNATNRSNVWIESDPWIQSVVIKYDHRPYRNIHPTLTGRQVVEFLEKNKDLFQQ